MQNDNSVLCPVCEAGKIVRIIIETPLMFMPTGVGLLPESIATQSDVLIYKCSNSHCNKLFHDPLGNHQIGESSSL